MALTGFLKRSKGEEISCSYGFGKRVKIDFDSAVHRVTASFEKNGFMVCCRVDVRDTQIRELEGVFQRYVLIGACHPPFAHRAFTADRNIGLLLPCNIVVYEEEDGAVTVMSMDPARIMDLMRSPAAIEVAIGLKEKLERIVASI